MSLSGDLSGQCHSREAADRDAGALAFVKAVPLMPFLSLLKNIYLPPKRRYALDDGSLARVPLQLYGHKSRRERELPTLQRKPRRRRDKAWLSRRDRLAIGAAAATPWQGEATS